ncbi:MAG: hypothetical protein PVI01_12005 [Gemmatimonadales bacterium]|jgi:hypothetical protein
MVTLKESTARHLNGNGKGLDIEAIDVTGQRRKRLLDYPTEATVRDLMGDLVDQLELNRTNPAGAPVVYHGRLQREARHLHNSEIVGEALRSGDVISLHPKINAGGGA